MATQREPRPGCRSGELAERTGVSADTLRHYERLGILPRPPRTAGGYRIYPPEAERRVRLIQNGLAVGLTLRELARVLEVRDAGGTPCRAVRALAAGKLQDVEERIEQLVQFRAGLRSVLRDWDRRLAGTARGQRAGLLDALGETGNAGLGRRQRRAAGRGGKKHINPWRKP